LDPNVVSLLRGIVDVGHEIGLHFDAEAHGISAATSEGLHACIAQDAEILEKVIKRPLRCVSWHNPELSNLLDLKDESICGLVNAYSARLQNDYNYCSDSNGYWRFRSMQDVIAEGCPRLHLLTHPEWWTPEPMSPSQRIDRALLGRARAARRAYNTALVRGGRTNVTG